jgi:hypothetical protein
MSNQFKADCIEDCIIRYPDSSFNFWDHVYRQIMQDNENFDGEEVLRKWMVDHMIAYAEAYVRSSV